MNDLDNYRKKIDDIDNKIIDLLNKRGEIVKLIGEIKKKKEIKIYQPNREEQIIERIKQKSTLLKPESIEAIWKEIMGACKVIQGSIFKVGFLGPEGTFTNQAAFTY